MPRDFSEYTMQFFWDFKKMDNVNYNFQIVETLYDARRTSSKKDLFNKPITLILVSITECLLEDFVVRIRTHVSDVIPNLPQRIILSIKGLQMDQFEHIIAQARKHNLLRVAVNDTIYDDLEYLRLARNRIHIQNTRDLGQRLDKDEILVFTDTTRERAEKIFERTCEILCNVHPRWGNVPIPMVDFPRPWI